MAETPTPSNGGFRCFFGTTTCFNADGDDYPFPLLPPPPPPSPPPPPPPLRQTLNYQSNSSGLHFLSPQEQQQQQQQPSSHPPLENSALELVNSTAKTEEILRRQLRMKIRRML